MARKKEIPLLKVGLGVIVLAIIFAALIWALAFMNGMTITAYLEDLNNTYGTTDIVNAILKPYNVWLAMVTSSDLTLMIYGWLILLSAITFTVFIAYPYIDDYIGLDPYGNRTKVVATYSGGRKRRRYPFRRRRR